MIEENTKQHLLFLWAFYAALTFVLGAVIYWTLFTFFKSYLLWGNPYGAIIHMHLYHWEYPYQYWGVLSFAFGFTAACWHKFATGKGTAVQLTSSLFTIPAAVFLAAIPGSMLWAIHDMQHGFFLGPAKSIQYMISWIPTGINVSFILMTNSWPLNLISISIALPLLHLAHRKLRPST